MNAPLYNINPIYSCFNWDRFFAQLARWYLRINPRGEVPSMSIRDPTKDEKDPDSIKIVTDSTRIIHTLESRVPIDAHPQLVPCTSDTVQYQKHVYYTALLDGVRNHS